MNSDNLKEKIRKTFSRSKMPFANEIVSAIDDESLDVRKIFEGKNWESIFISDLLKNKSAIFFLTPRAHRYYMPSYLLAILEDFDGSDRLPGSILSSLTISQENEGYTKLRLMEFNVNEITIILEFLNYLKDKYIFDGMEADLERAIKSVESILNTKG
jgi:hypothetical protein